MARQLGHVKYKGTIGEIRHFKIKGMTGNFAGLKGVQLVSKSRMILGLSEPEKT